MYGQQGRRLGMRDVSPPPIRPPGVDRDRLLCVALLTGALIGALVPTRPAGGQRPSQFDLLPDLLTARFSHQATALPDGRVLISGGTLQGESLNTATAELFVPDAGVFRTRAP